MKEFVTNPVWQALIAGGVAWFATAFGSALVFITHRLRDHAQELLLGAAVGIMLAVTYELADSAKHLAGGNLVPVFSGFLVGTLSMYVLDRLLPHLHPGFVVPEMEGIPTRWSGGILLVLAITLHNIPEGLAIGVSFGAAGYATSAVQYGDAVATSTGIALQDVIEGLLVAIPLYQAGMPVRRAFLWGQASGIVEPVAAVIGALLVTHAQTILPHSLAFSAGAMFYVVFDELIPEMRRGKHTHWAVWGTVVGFAIMMALKITLE